MEISALVNGMKASAEDVQNSAVQPLQESVKAKDVLSEYEKNFFDKLLNTSISESPELFSNQGISTLSVHEMSYWSLELHNFGCKNQSG